MMSEINPQTSPEGEDAAVCPRCGAELPDDSPRGLCPRCLMAEAMTPTEYPNQPPRPEPPAIEEVQEAFPQLEILELVGVGGMGVVFKARQTSLNRLVALKLLAPHRTHEAGFSERFTREAQALAALNHPNIVTVHDFGQADGFYYLLMEYVDGVNLRQAIKAERFTPEQALAIVPPICVALQYAHDRGIVHRDIKPENLLLDKEGRIKVADFGIARILDREEPGEEKREGEEPSVDPGLTAGTALGTPNYMAPEQAEHPEQVDHRADIYSLGAVFYELLTGEPPDGRLQPPSTTVKLDVRIDEIVLKALADSPELRWQTATDLRTQVETIASTAPPPLTDVPPPPREPEKASSEESSSHRQKGNGALWLAIGLAIPGIPLLLLGLYILLLLTREPDWNPAVGEAVWAFGTWIGALVFCGASLISFAAWLRRQDTGRKKTSALVGGGLLLLLAVIVLPFIVSGVARTQEARAEAEQARQRTLAAESAIRRQQLHNDLAEAEVALIKSENPTERREQELRIAKLRSELETLEASRIHAESHSRSETHRATPTESFSRIFVFVILFGIVLVPLVIVIALNAKRPRGSAIGCTIAILLVGLFVCLPVLVYLFSARWMAQAPPDHVRVLDQSDRAKVRVSRGSFQSYPGQSRTDFYFRIERKGELPQGWALWVVVQRREPANPTAPSGAEITRGETTFRVAPDGRAVFSIENLRMSHDSGRQFGESTLFNADRDLILTPGDQVLLFEFGPENGDRIVGTLELRPELETATLPSQQIYLRDFRGGIRDGFLAFAWSETATNEGLELVLETHGAAVQTSSMGDLDSAEFVTINDPSRFEFTRRKLSGGGTLRFALPSSEFPASGNGALEVTPMGTRLVLREGDSHRLFEITDGNGDRQAWADLRAVSANSTTELLPGKRPRVENADPDSASDEGPFPPPPSGGAFTCERQVAMPGEARLGIRVEYSHRDAEEEQLGETLVVKTPIDSAEGIVMCWLAYAPDHPTEPGRFVIDFVAANTGRTFHRVEGEFPPEMSATSPDHPSLPERKELAILSDPGSRMTFRLLRATGEDESTGLIRDWCEVDCTLELIDPRTEGRPAEFQLPPREEPELEARRANTDDHGSHRPLPSPAAL